MRIYPLVAALLVVLSSCAHDAPEAPDSEGGTPDEGALGPVVTTPASLLGLSADSICMQQFLNGPPPRQDDVRIRSTTGTAISGLEATITYGPGQPTGWLVASFDRTTTEARLWLYAGTSGEPTPEGDWWADVSVSAPTAGAPRVIRVHYTVKPPRTDALVTLKLGGQSINDVSPGTGTVTGSGFDCDFRPGTTCSQRLPLGTVVTLTATPDSGQLFLYWYAQECSPEREPTCTFTVTSDTDITAYFYLQGYGIVLTMSGADASGHVDAFVTPGGNDISCDLTSGVQSGQCSVLQWYGARGSSLTARAAPGSVFVGWTGCSSADGTTCNLDAAPGGGYSVTATFAKE